MTGRQSEDYCTEKSFLPWQFIDLDRSQLEIAVEMDCWLTICPMGKSGLPYAAGGSIWHVIRIERILQAKRTRI